ncbi:extracellular matrix-binding ebh [Babesia caballi]|uniref:Extracellular matrix-binding ebh n=1 Tax=Babesia caballi TaxID=5871 RepID=A0AAV4LRG1_BABCB|nr:extracellular matrix-binding ebh [Babesia caballi]
MPASVGKFLTQPPENLKEAIDWVLRVSGRDSKNNENDAIKGLAKEVKKLLSNDAREVAEGVLRVMGENLKKVVGDLKQLHGKNEISTFVLRGLLKRVHTNLKHVSDYGSAASPALIKKLCGLLQKDVESPGEGPIGKLVKGISTLIGCKAYNQFTGQGLIKQNGGPYTSAYPSASHWNNISEPDRRACALMFMGIGPILFLFLTYLYWNCEQSNGHWKSSSFSGSVSSDALSAYLDAMGFKHAEFNQQKNQASQIAEVLKQAFSELNENVTSAYSCYLGRLLNEAITNDNFPLSLSYLIATSFFTPNDTYTVEISSPATPSFLGYSGLAALGSGAYGLNLAGLGTFMSALLAYPTIRPYLSSGCPSNLKEAIDWILRVTGKDGQHTGSHGQEVINDLTKQVKELLESVQGSTTAHGEEIGKVIQALGTDQNGLIKSLADGLQQFIGYDGGMLNNNNTPRITGAGIAPSNIATHRLCDAAIAFTIGVLESLSKDRSIKSNSVNKQNVDSVISKLSGCYGKGPKGLKDIDREVDKLGEVKGQGTNMTAFNNIVNAVKGFKNQLKNATENDIDQKVGTYLNEIFKAGNASKVNVTTQLQQLVTNNSGIYDATQLRTQINNVKTLLQTGSQGFAKNVLDAGKNAFIWQLEKGNYTPTNYETPKQPITFDATHAKIFLSCLPLYYQALTYIYWGCHKGGPWRNLTLGGGDLRSYFDSQGLLSPYVESSRTGAHIAESALQKFSEFGTAAASSLSSPNSPYVKFTEALQKNVTTNGNQLSSTCPLSALFYGASCYFRYQQITTANIAVRVPKTIREMLYFLAALQFSPQYEALDSYVTEYFRTLLGKQSEDRTDDFDLKLQVADSGLSTADNTLSAADLKSYLTSTFHLAPALLGVIQDHSASDDSKSDDPWLDSLFSNSQFNLSIPSSGAILFSALSNYTYALHFQLSFLYIQCRNTYTVECGWRDCRFGKDINKGSTNPVLSHICKAYNCGDNNVNCSHNGTSSNESTTECTHNQGGYGAKCGKTGTPSPLQAFLTDNLKGFSRGHPSDPSSHLAFCSGPMCHVPMGFSRALTKDPNATGWYIYYLLDHFCSRPYSPLRQLCEKLGCLTKRTPMTLGDVFGFIWTLNYQLFNNADILNKLREALGKRPTSVDNFIGELTQLASSLKPSPENSGLVKSLQTMTPVIPFLYQLFTVKPDNFLPVTLFNLAQHCHKVESHGNSFTIVHKSPSNSVVTSGHQCSDCPNDLWSLYQPVSAAPERDTDPQSACRNAQCGGYLYPLTHSAGATYSPVHASVYLSWLAYLTDDFHEWFQNLLDEFKNIDCSKTGCKRKNGGICHCPKGQHGSASPQCSCDSVVHCGGVLPLLYRYGFSFHNAYSLKGGMHGSDRTKRNCNKFHDQLSAVLAQNENTPLFKLLTTIDDLLYLFRFYFVYNLFTFWIMYLCIVLYIYFLRVDLLHIRSHMHLPSSHSVAPIAPLTTGKAADLTKLKYFIS